MRSHQVDLHIKRVYAPRSKDDGKRILVDRLWPRGMTKQRADVDLWLKDIAPSTELRKWFGHDPGRWPEFRQKYIQELQTRSPELDALRDDATRGAVTLLYGAKDEIHNEAAVLLELLQKDA